MSDRMRPALAAALLLGLLAPPLVAQVPHIPGPKMSALAAPRLPSLKTTASIDFPADSTSGGGRSLWLPVGIGLFVGTALGISYASSGCDCEGEELRTGVGMALVVAIPVTVIAAILLGSGD